MGYYLGAYWYNRSISIEHTAIAITNFMQRIKNIGSPDLSSWFELGYSREQALQTPILFQKNEVEAFLIKRNKLKGKVKNSPFYSDSGFRFNGWNGSFDENTSISISFSVGSVGHFVPNFCVFDLHEGILTNYSLLMDLFTELITFWQPEWAVFNSSELSDAVRAENKIGLISFYSHDFQLPKTYDDDFLMSKKTELGTILEIKGNYDNVGAMDIKKLKSLYKDIYDLNPDKHAVFPKPDKN